MLSRSWYSQHRKTWCAPTYATRCIKFWSLYTYTVSITFLITISKKKCDCVKACLPDAINRCCYVFDMVVYIYVWISRSLNMSLEWRVLLLILNTHSSPCSPAMWTCLFRDTWQSPKLENFSLLCTFLCVCHQFQGIWVFF